MSDPESRPAKRIRQACDSCHFKKIKCIRPGEAGIGTCERCRAEGASCVFSPALKTGRPKKADASFRAVPDRPSSPAADVRAAAAADLFPADVLGLSPFLEESMSGYTFTGIDLGILDPDRAFLSGGVSRPPSSKDEVETTVLRKLEYLTSLQQQLIQKRHNLTQSLGEVLEISNNLVDTLVFLFQEGSRYSHRDPILDLMSDETAIMMVVAPGMLVLDMFEDILNLLSEFGRYSPPRSSPPRKDPQQSSSSSAIPPSFDAETVDPSLLGSAYSSLFSHTSSILGLRVEGFELHDPMRQYLVVSMMEYHLDRMKRTVEMAVAAFPRMDRERGADGLLAVMIGQFRRKLDSLHGEASRVASETKMTGIS